MSRVRGLVELLKVGVDGGIEGVPPGSFSVWDSKFPSDYLAVVKEMGSGFSFDEKIGVYHPKLAEGGVEQTRRDLVYIHDADGAYFSDGRLMHSEKQPSGEDHVRFSDLICWGEDDSGNKLFWEAVGDPNDWQVIATDCGSFWARHEMSFSDYLYGIISREVFCSVLTRPDWPRGEVRDVIVHEIDF